jgi:hypothetical protein
MEGAGGNNVVDEFRFDDFVMTLQVQGCSCRRNSVSVSGREVLPAYYVGDVLGSENCELRLVCKVQIVWFWGLQVQVLYN